MKVMEYIGLNDIKNKNVMELNLMNDGNLVIFINDIRLLKKFGYKIPKQLQNGYEIAYKFYKYVIKLEQIN